jgi:hypothetical protein
VVPRHSRSRQFTPHRGARAPHLVAHNLLLGDTFMLTPLLAKLRRLHAEGEITLLAAPASSLYEKRPWRRALPFTPSVRNHARSSKNLSISRSCRATTATAGLPPRWARGTSSCMRARPLTQEWFVDGGA